MIQDQIFKKLYNSCLQAQDLDNPIICDSNVGCQIVVYKKMKNGFSNGFLYQTRSRNSF